MGQNDIRRLLIVAAMSRIRWIVRKGALPEILAWPHTRPQGADGRSRALANKMARVIWAMMTWEENFRMALFR